MIELRRLEDCCGCTSCASACPIGCIRMQEDFEGFKYPLVDKERCIECKKCIMVCPVINKPINTKSPRAYLARTKDDLLLMKCTSGGVFTEIARRTVEQGGIAYGVIYDKNFIVRHERICDLSEIMKLPGSKYVQSDLNGIFNRILDDLEAGKNTVFCGTPCQVAGLKSFLGKEYENLLLVDLVCHGVPSPILWKTYVEYLEAKNGKLSYANFRSKRLGYHVSVMEERFECGKIQIGSARTNLMSKCFFQNAADRPICYACPFKTVPRCSDLTIFDGWHARNYVTDMKDDDKGYTVILVQSDTGEKAIKAYEKYFYIYKISTEKAINLDGIMATNSVDRPPTREKFYLLLERYGIEKTIEELFPITKKDYLVEEVKVVLKKMGILSIVNAIKNQCFFRTFV